MWNHRDLEDPIQRAIEDTICRHVDGYSYGIRREDQSGVIKESKLFGEVIRVEAGVTHQVAKMDLIEAWRSHATLQRQAGAKFQAVVSEIEKYLSSLTQPIIEVPYTTRIWMAQAL
jgi:hypothetical protein